MPRPAPALTGLDTSAEALREARNRAIDAVVDLDLVCADLDEPLAFADAAFDAVTSRLSRMVTSDSLTTLRELVRGLAPKGRLTTVLWASLPLNPWFAAPREAIAAVLGPERASFARAFGRLGAPGEAAALHREAGLDDVEARLLREVAHRTDAADHWAQLSRDNGHFRRVDASLDAEKRTAIIADLEPRLAEYRCDGELAVPRTLLLVTGRRPGTPPA